MVNSKSSLKVKLFADGADISGMIEMASKSYISGLTTNPTLMRKAGITNYRDFAREVLDAIPDKPISFEVFSDELEEMRIQSEVIDSWGNNVFVKIPITNTRGISTAPLLKYLSSNGIKVNVTAMMTAKQIDEITDYLNPDSDSYVSVFAGRIADTGRDPVPIMKECLEKISGNPKCKLIWASPRELLNVFQANDIGCHIITATNDILKKLELVDKDLDEYSLDTVKMFYDDAVQSRYSIS